MRAWLIILFVLIATSSSAEVFFHDNFESGDISTTNADGFAWAVMNRTSLVTMNPTIGQGTCTGSESGAYAIWNNGAICNPGGDKDWNAYEGDISMRFRYPAGEAWAEQRFDMGASYLEYWMSFWLRVPTNYKYTNPSGATANNKLTAQYMDGYSQAGTGATLVTGWWQNSTDPTSADLSVGYFVPGRINTTISGNYPLFINSATDKGRWMHIVMYIKAETSSFANDGIFKFYRKWEGDSDYVLMFDLTGLELGLGAAAGFKGGYLMGYANGDYEVDTEFLLDDFKLSTADLRESGGPPVGNAIGNARYSPSSRARYSPTSFSPFVAQ